LVTTPKQVITCGQEYKVLFTIEITPQHVHIIWYDYPNSTATVTYAPAIRCSSNTSYTLSLNRTLSSNGQWAYETGVSTGIAIEFAQ